MEINKVVYGDKVLMDTTDVTVDIPVEKEWLHDNGGEEGLRTPVEVELFTVEGETETTTGKKLTLSESNQWKGNRFIFPYQ